MHSAEYFAELGECDVDDRKDQRRPIHWEMS